MADAVDELKPAVPVTDQQLIAGVVVLLRKIDLPDDLLVKGAGGEKALEEAAAHHRVDRMKFFLFLTGRQLHG